MGRVKDLWVNADGTKTSRHPVNGGNKKAKRWQAEWEDPDGKKPTRTFHKKSDAEAHWKKMEADADRGEYIDPAAGKELLGPLLRKHLRLQKVGRRTRRQYEGMLTNHVDPVFAHRRVRNVKPSEIVEWLRGPLASKSESLQWTAFHLLRGAFDLAVADKLRRDNPARSPIVPVPESGDPAPRDVWSVETAWKVIDEHPGQYRAIPVCEAGLGVRECCAFGLAEEDFDFDKMTVEIRRQVIRDGGRAYFKLPKGGKTRTVPLSRGVAAVIRAHIEQYRPVETTLPWMNEDGTIADDPRTCRLLFVWHGARNPGGPISATSFIETVWNPALSRAGVAPPPEKDTAGNLKYRSGGRQNGQHMLRHVYETVLDNGGVSLAGMMEFMGHSRKGQVITIGVYGHVTEETFEKARQAVDATLFALRPVSAGGTVAELRAAR